MKIQKIVILWIALIAPWSIRHLLGAELLSEVPTNTIHERALKKGLDDCKNGEIKLGLVSLRFAEFSASTNKDLVKTKFNTLLCLSESNLMKTFNSELEAIEKMSLTPTVREKVALLKVMNGYEGVQILNANDARRLRLWELSKNLNDLKSFYATGSEESQQIEQAKQLSDVKTLSYRSPLVLGISSSILPGSGQAIQGNWSSAGTAFALNALLLGTTIEFANKGQPFGTALSALLFSMVYVGNIVNSANQAITYNEAKTNEFGRSLKWILFPDLRVEF